MINSDKKLLKNKKNNKNIKTKGATMSKKILTFLAVLALSLAGCGGGGGSSNSGSSGTNTTPVGLYVYGTQTLNGDSAPGEVVYSTLSSVGSMITTGTGPATQDYPYGVYSVNIGGGNYLYVANRNSNSVSEYSVSGTTITSLGTVGLSYQPISGAMAYSKTQQTLYVAYSGGIAAMSVSGTGGLGSPTYYPDPNSYTAWVLSVDATGNYLVAADQITSTTWAAQLWQINSGGSLTAKNLSGTVQELAETLVADPNTTNGDFLYGYTALLSISGGNITATDLSGFSGTCAPSCNVNPIWIDPTGTWLYVVVSDGNTGSIYTKMEQYSIGSTGTVSLVNSQQVSTNWYPGQLPTAYYSSSNGYLTVDEQYLWTFSFNSLNGNLSLLNSADFSSGSTAILP